jgi:glycosyltransferase involved in cell wall biosynthesis
LRGSYDVTWVVVAVYSDLEYRRIDGRVFASESFVLFASRMADFGHRIVILGRCSPEPAASYYELPPHVEFVALPHYASLARPRGALHAFRESLRVFNEVLERVDVTWLLGPHPMALGFALAARRRGKRIVLGVRQDMPAYVRHRHAGRPLLGASALALEAAWRWLARRSPIVTIGGDLAQRYRGAALVVPLSVSLISERDIVDIEDTLKRSYDGELKLLSVGRLDPEKNPLLLADVLAQLRAKDPRWQLVVCGSGSMEAALRRRLDELGVSDNAELRGYVPLEALTVTYRESHAFLHVAWTEGVPQVLFEAFAAGVPVVATAVGGVADAADGGALIVAPGDAAAAVTSLRRLVRDPELRADLIKNGREIAMRTTTEVEAGRLARVLEEAAAQ